jgi:23S rRNA (cytosine1962-C5)-methyltransferase
LTPAALPHAWDPEQYELLDAGDGRRLERIGGLVLDRPAPGARDPRSTAGWDAADAQYQRGAADSGQWLPEAPAEWTVRHGPLVLAARATPSGGVGVFPEQVGNWAWIAAQVAERRSGSSPPEVLNLFAHTGAATLAAAAAGARVAHVDASRPAVTWARRNSELSGLADAQIRWLVDDTLGFVRRESRRGRRYDVVILDPPSYGHAPNRVRWQLADQLPDLLAATRSVLADGSAVLLTAHTPGYDAERLALALGDALELPARAVEAEELELVAATGARLPAGAFARVDAVP